MDVYIFSGGVPSHPLPVCFLTSKFLTSNSHIFAGGSITVSYRWLIFSVS